jgi:hypothetical protein
MKKINHRMGEIFANHIAKNDPEYIKNLKVKSDKCLIQIKIGQGFKYKFLQRDASGQKAHEKFLNSLSHQRNENQNHYEIPLHIQQDGHKDKTKGKMESNKYCGLEAWLKW